MSAPETFDLEIEFHSFRVKAQLYGDEEDVELLSVTLNPDAFWSIEAPLYLFSTEQKGRFRADWLAAKKESDELAESERQASAAETRAHFRREP